MAQPTGTFATNDAVGIREDLSDVITNIAPFETPFYSSAKHTEASNVLHEWQTDTLAAAANNKAIQGDDAPQNSGTATTRLNNRTQISTKDARVTGTMRSVDTAGRSDELDYQLLKRGRELRRDIEFVLLSNKAKVTGDDTTAPELAGVPSWIATNESTSGSAPAGDGSDTRTNGTQRAFTENLLKPVLVDIFDEGGYPDCLMLGPFNRQKASTFTGGNTSMQKAEDKTLHATYDVYESDFGELKIVPNRFQRERDGLILEMDKWEVAFLPGRNMTSFDIAKTGDSDARQILSEYTLVARQEKANGIVADLTDS